MRILQLISYFAPAWAYGGSVRAVYEISKRLVERGHEVEVMTTDVWDVKRRVEKKTTKIDGVKINYFPTISNWLSWHFKGFISPQMYFSLNEKISNFDVVHLHEFYTFQGIITHFLCQKFKIPYVFSGHGSVLPLPERGRQSVKRMYTWLWGGKIIRDASTLIALSQTEKKQYLKFKNTGSRIQIIPNGIDLDEFKKLPPKGSFRQRYNLREEKIVLFIGRIYQVKGLDLLISGLSGWLKKDKKTTLVIVGPDAGSLSDLKKQARNLKVGQKIIFPGYLEGEEKLAVYVDADVYVQPSRSEGFPVSVLEAGACGLPLVVTHTSNVPEVDDFRAGLVVDAKEKELKKAVVRLLRDKFLRREMGGRAKKMVQQKFGWEEIVGKLEGIYAKA